MTDTPALCIPPEPSVSGWWWLENRWGSELAYLWSSPIEHGGGNGCWLSMAYNGSAMSPLAAGIVGFSILGPVATHAEVEALRAEIQRLRAALQAVKDAAAYADGSLTDCGNIASDAHNGGTTP